MNEKTRAQIEAMKNQTIGVEIEMNNITREKAAKKAAEFFGTGRYEYTAGRNGYFAWSAWDAQGREWKFQRDVSIEGPDSQKCELVTPILIYDDIEMLQKLVRLLRKAGAKSSPSRGCGVHYASSGVIGKILKKVQFYQPFLSKSFHNNHSQYLLSQSRSDGLFRYSVGVVSGTFICSFAALSASWRCLLSIRAYTSVVFICSCPSWSRM